MTSPHMRRRPTMKRSLFIAAAVVAMFFIVSCNGNGTVTGPSASTISAAQTSENTDQIITRLEHEWVAAIVKGDTGVFSGHYLFTDVWTRKNGEWIAVASHGSRER